MITMECNQKISVCIVLEFNLSNNEANEYLLTIAKKEKEEEKGGFIPVCHHVLHL